MSYLEFSFIFYPLDTYLALWKWTLKPSDQVPALVMGQERSLAPGLWCFLAWLCPPYWLHLSFCFPVPTLALFPFLVLVSSSFFRHLLTRKKRGRDIFLLKMKLLWNHGVLPVSGVAPTGRRVGCTSGPFLLLPSYPGLLFRHQCPPTYPPAQVFVSLFLSPLVSEIFWSPNWDAWQRRFSHLWIYLLDKP